MEFASLIKGERAKRFPSGRNFHQKAALSCAYQNYALIESGKSLPGLKLAIEILDALNPGLKKAGLYAWVRDQMPDRETRSFFTHFHMAPTRSGHQTSVDQSLVINRMQAKLLIQTPVLWEIVLFLCIQQDRGRACTLQELAREFKAMRAEMKQHLEQLFEYGLIERRLKAEVEYYSKPWVFIPYEEEFQELRESNFRHAVRKFIEERSDSKFRTTITRPLTAIQRKELEAAVLALTNYIIDLPEEKAAAKAELCTVGIFSSVRRFGNA